MRVLFLLVLGLLVAQGRAATLQTVRVKMDSLLRTEQAAWMKSNQGRTDTISANLDLRFRVNRQGDVVSVSVDSSRNMPVVFQEGIVSKVRQLNFGQETSEFDVFTYTMLFTYQGPTVQSALGQDFWIRMSAVAIAIVLGNLVVAAIR